MSLSRPGVAASLVVLALVAGGGCAGAPRRLGEAQATAGSTAVLTGDWDDVNAAVNIGVGPAEAAVLDVQRPDSDTIIYSLITITDQPGTLTITRTERADALQFVVRLGPTGDPVREQRFLYAAQRRLTQLHGVPWAPVE